LDDLIEEKLLKAEAEKQKIAVDELMKKEVDDKLEKTTEADIQNFYNMYKTQMNNQPLEQVKSTIVKRLESTKRNVKYNELLTRLEKDNKVEILMERPRVTVSTDDDPSMGEKGAPITLIEFSEYQCPFCKRARLVVNQILETYKGKVFYVFRDYPLSFHKNAPKAAEAANCAGDQDKYWQFSNGLWDDQANLRPEVYSKIAKSIGLNEEKFKKCIESGKFTAEIEKDIQDGEDAGVSGTPAYFINGIFISGAQPFEKFQQLIDEELKRVK
jgi:protein-disulfide isomerase